MFLYPRGSDFFSTFSSDKVTLALRGPQRFTVGFSFKEKTFTFCLVRCMAGFTCGRQQRFFHQTASLHLFSLHRGRVETLANVKDNSIDFSRRCTEQHYLFIQGEQFKSPDILHSVQKTCAMCIFKRLTVQLHVFCYKYCSKFCNNRRRVLWGKHSFPGLRALPLHNSHACTFTCLHGEMFCIQNVFYHILHIWQL